MSDDFATKAELAVIHARVSQLETDMSTVRTTLHRLEGAVQRVVDSATAHQLTLEKVERSLAVIVVLLKGHA